MSAACVVRRVQPGDLEVLVAMCGEHARYEKAPLAPMVTAGSLAHALFSSSPRLHAWVADVAGERVGYATATLEFSTWQAREFLHMDCLFVRDGKRGNGSGAALLEAVSDFAHRAGCTEIQWQTPEWNQDAARFYRRVGAVETPKRRFFLRLGGTSRRQTCRVRGRPGAPPAVR